MEKILVFGGAGLVGSRFISLHEDKFKIFSPTIDEIDILDPVQLRKAVDDTNPDIILNFAAFTNVGLAEKEKDDKEGLVYKINALGVRNLGLLCQELDKYLIHISTDYVFDGKKSEEPYKEDDQPNPISWYGVTKHEGEIFFQESGCKGVIARISMPYSGDFADKKDVARFFVDQLSQGKEVLAIDDQYIVPTFVDDIANSLKIFAEENPEGIFHVAAADWTTPFQFAKMIAEKFQFDTNLVKAVSLADFEKDRPYKMPKYSWLDTDKFRTRFKEGVLHNIAYSLDLFKKDYFSKVDFKD